MQPFRIQPRMPVNAYKTYRVFSPPDVMLPAACHDVGCAAWRHGWDTTVDERTDLGMMQAAYIRQRSGRTFREMHAEDGRTVFRFESGQRCFAEHSTRPERWIVRDGDWRGNPTGASRLHIRPDDWVEDFGLHQQKLADRLAQG